MVSICFYFQVHQPFRLRKYSVFDIGKNHSYFDNKKNIEVMLKIGRKCYLPMNRLLLEQINRYKDAERDFKVSFSITGTALEQFEQYFPDVLDTFKELAKTKKVEFLSETYYHSLSYLYSKDEFRQQIEMHRDKIKKLFGQTPSIFRNTELIYNNDMAKVIEDMGYKGILAEGWDKCLEWRSPNFVYKPAGCEKIRLLLKNYRLSDDIAFRFSNRGWNEWPLTAEKYMQWVNSVNGNGTNINLFMDYETFGEHQWGDTGIFDFMKRLPEEVLRNPDNNFKLPSELVKDHEPVGEINVPFTLSWADVERDLSAWLGNRMQQSAIKQLYMLEKEIKMIGDKELLEEWRKMQTSDHFYYMCVKYFSDGDVHKYFNPYDTPYDGFITFMNALNDLVLRVKQRNGSLYLDAPAGNKSSSQVFRS
ncbi:alpha-amylase [Candidatus Woesearchaeota archaeon CG10_big_fil_rev_8_21_14_0_10_44_13]|nr:MAG: alpha-amylase [Candidatus Woesearchaeota archaeon CG10_big_fil_rev_8_21_14_0_10_44_13]